MVVAHKENKQTKRGVGRFCRRQIIAEEVVWLLLLDLRGFRPPCSGHYFEEFVMCKPRRCGCAEHLGRPSDFENLIVGLHSQPRHHGGPGR